MNATVTKSAKKSTTAKKATKVAVKAKTPAKPVAGKTKSKPVAKKATPAKAVKKPAPKAKAPAKSASKPAKPVVKAVAKKVAKAPAKPAVKVKAKTPSKAPAKTPSKVAAKPAVKAPVVKKVPASTVKAAVKAVAPKSVIPKSTATPVAKAAVQAVPKQVAPAMQKPKAAVPVASPVAVKSGTSMSSNKAPAVIVDKIQKFEVSKVSEVATKTSKVTPALPGDGIPLTEEQILKMGEKDYMNSAQLAFFKARLQQLEKDLLKNAGETTEHLRETVLVPDPADRATIEEEHALELRTRDRERKLLKKVQQSIATIDAGEYGWCEETGEPIGVPRLLARPTATLSLEAQQRRELKQKLYGD